MKFLGVSLDICTVLGTKVPEIRLVWGRPWNITGVLKNEKKLWALKGVPDRRKRMEKWVGRPNDKRNQDFGFFSDHSDGKGI